MLQPDFSYAVANENRLNRARVDRGLSPETAWNDVANNRSERSPQYSAQTVAAPVTPWRWPWEKDPAPADLPPEIAQAIAELTPSDKQIALLNADPYGEYLGNMRAQQNPFGANNPQFQSYLQGQLATYRRNMAPQQQRLAGQLAGRGLMGSGMEAAQRSALTGQQATGLAELQTRLQGEQYEKGSEWDRWRQQTMLDALGGQSRDVLGKQNLALQRTMGKGDLAMRGADFGLRRDLGIGNLDLQRELGRGQLAESAADRLSRESLTKQQLAEAVAGRKQTGVFKGRELDLREKEMQNAGLGDLSRLLSALFGGR